MERKNIQTMSGYTWGEQPESTTVIKLNTNENPYPPSPNLDRALANISADMLRVYPSPLANELRDFLAGLHNLERDNFLVVNGGDELLRLLFTTFLNPGEPFGMAEPSYSLYPVLAQINDSPVVRVNLEADWSLPRDFSQRLNNQGVKLACIVCPHAPSGSLVNVDILSRVVSEFKGVILIDEAYVDFVDPALRHDSTRLINAFDNLVILRSLSKGYSLAGLRAGYAIAPAELIKPMLTKTRDSYNINTVSQTLALEALKDQEYAQTTWQKVRQSRRELRKQLTHRGFDVPPSQANFLLAEMPDHSEHSAAQLLSALRKHEILVRHFDTPGLEDKLRISIGTEHQNASLLHALDQIGMT
jgi:histidinol-phosphate aminotransferase